MLVTVEQLEVGDEILIPCQVDFKRLRIERKPVITPEGYWKNVRCAIRNESIGTQNRYSNYNCSNEQYNDIIHMDLAYRRMWLIKKGQP